MDRPLCPRLTRLYVHYSLLIGLPVCDQVLLRSIYMASSSDMASI